MDYLDNPLVMSGVGIGKGDLSRLIALPRDWIDLQNLRLLDDASWSDLDWCAFESISIVEYRLHVNRILSRKYRLVQKIMALLR